jgi:excisionase family DNA binding protein
MEKEFEAINSRLDKIEAYSLLNAKTVLTLTEAHVFTGLSKSHLYKLTCTKQIPHYKPNGKTIYFDKKELTDWMKHGRINSNDEATQQATAFIVRKGVI